ncbi:MAG: DsrE family protein [Actinobacteria bacterium]|nr:DsrE family protein [Actinomycetota bacterium]
MKYLFILNDPAYGTERSYNALRLAMKVRKQEPKAEIAIFLMGDAVICAKRGQKTPDGYYNLERMLKPFTRHGEVLLCSTRMDARGMEPDEATPGARRSSMDELTQRTLAADKVLVF